MLRKVVILSFFFILVNYSFATPSDISKVAAYEKMTQVLDLVLENQQDRVEKSRSDALWTTIIISVLALLLTFCIVMILYTYKTGKVLFVRGSNGKSKVTNILTTTDIETLSKALDGFRERILKDSNDNFKQLDGVIEHLNKENSSVLVSVGHAIENNNKVIAQSTQTLKDLSVKVEHTYTEMKRIEETTRSTDKTLDKVAANLELMSKLQMAAVPNRKE